MPVFIGLLIVVVLFIGIAWLGTQIPMAGFKSPHQTPFAPDTITHPQHLPAPVARYAETIFGTHIPCISSALVIGNAQLTFKGITFPARFKFYYEAGQAYYHLIQLGWFGYPILTVHERYQNGQATMALPGNLIENDAKTNASANLGLWAEGIWIPSIWFTDSRIRWEEIDDTSARLIVPNAADEETFVVRFDPQTHLIKDLTSMRYQAPESAERIPWINRALKWHILNGRETPVEAELQWGQDKPWALWQVKTILYNVDVAARLAQFGAAEID